MKGFRACLPVVLFAVLAALAACSPEEEANPVEPSGEDTTNPAQSTVALSTTPETTGEETTAVRERTLGPSVERPDAVLRLEGDPSARFSGICEVGGEESVLSGRLPKRFTFDLDGTGLSCRIQKQDEGSGNLRVILLSGNTTRSVQQTNTPEGVIEVSYNGN